jgi:hypothetical protein
LRSKLRCSHVKRFWWWWVPVKGAFATARYQIIGLIATSLGLSADEVNALVLDIGSSSVKAGYSGDDGPKGIFPSVWKAMALQCCGKDMA